MILLAFSLPTVRLVDPTARLLFRRHFGSISLSLFLSVPALPCLWVLHHHCSVVVSPLSIRRRFVLDDHPTKLVTSLASSCLCYSSSDPPVLHCFSLSCTGNTLPLSSFLIYILLQLASLLASFFPRARAVRECLESSLRSVSFSPSLCSASSATISLLLLPSHTLSSPPLLLYAFFPSSCVSMCFFSS